MPPTQDIKSEKQKPETRDQTEFRFFVFPPCFCYFDATGWSSTFFEYHDIIGAMPNSRWLSSGLVLPSEEPLDNKNWIGTRFVLVKSMRSETICNRFHDDPCQRSPKTTPLSVSTFESIVCYILVAATPPSYASSKTKKKTEKNRPKTQNEKLAESFVPDVEQTVQACICRSIAYCRINLTWMSERAARAGRASIQEWKKCRRLYE